LTGNHWNHKVLTRVDTRVDTRTSFTWHFTSVLDDLKICQPSWSPQSLFHKISMKFITSYTYIVIHLYIVIHNISIIVHNICMWNLLFFRRLFRAIISVFLRVEKYRYNCVKWSSNFCISHLFNERVENSETFTKSGHN